MRGYDRSPVEDLDEYEEEGSEDGAEEEEQEEYEEEEQPRQPTKEELEYLELRKRLKESFRKKIKKENGSAQANCQEKKNKLPYDNYGSFFGPSQPIIAQRVIQESKSLLETQHLASKIPNSHPNNKKDYASTAARPNQLNVAKELKTKVQKLRDTRDYSFLLSDDAELPVQKKESQPRNASVSNSEARLSKAPAKSQSKQSSSNSFRQVLNGREERKGIPTNGQMQPKSGSHKFTSNSKPNIMSVDSRKQLGSNNGNGPGRPVGPKSLPSKTSAAAMGKKAPALGMKNSMSAVHKPPPSKHTSVPKQQFQPKNRSQEHSKGKMMPKQPVTLKQPVASSKTQPNKPFKQISSHASLQEHRHKKKPVRRYSDDEDDDEDGRAISMIRKMFRYNPNKFSGRDDDDSDMEANFDDILKEERRSARIARQEDEEELKRIEEEERRERMRKTEKKRKLSQR
ncbi:protein spt2-like [Malania oleifera]|uniref:protein spt2-like n=1 Tax=Malania oleifera TaxID=397392 RepID=UPI0025AEA5B0|nr:protein spt2-like [Malania oleifera]